MIIMFRNEGSRRSNQTDRYMLHIICTIANSDHTYWLTALPTRTLLLCLGYRLTFEELTRNRQAAPPSSNWGNSCDSRLKGPPCLKGTNGALSSRPYSICGRNSTLDPVVWFKSRCRRRKGVAEKSHRVGLNGFFTSFFRQQRLHDFPRLRN